MAVRTRGLLNTFDELKRKNPKMSDEEAMKRAMEISSAATLATTETEYQRTKPDTWVGKLKMGVTGKLAKSRHSPAGRKHLENK